MPPLVLLAVATLAGNLAAPWLDPTPAPCLAGVAAIAGLSLLPGARRLHPFLLGAGGLLLGLSFSSRLPPPATFLGEGRVRARVATAAVGREADVDVTSWEPLDGQALASPGRIRVRFPDTPPPPGVAFLAVGRATRIDPTHLPGAPDPVAPARRAHVRRELRAREVTVLGPDPSPARGTDLPHAGLLRALWDGDRSGITTADADLFRRTGTWHLVSISGLHIGLAAAAGWGLGWLATRPLVLLRAPRGAPWLCALAAVVCAWWYARHSGESVPAMRAVWMSAAGAACVAAGRRPGAWETLALALVGTMWAEPGAVATAGFQLSFGGLAGILLVHPRVTRWLPPDAPRAARLAVGAVATSIGATAGTLPVTAWLFQSLSPLAVLANLWAVPWIGSIASPAVVVGHALPGAAGDLSLAVADAAITIGLAGLHKVDVPPWHPAVGPLGAAALVGAVLLRRHLWAWAGLTGLALLWHGPERGSLTVSFLAVGQGDATLVEWPDGRRWLIDGGPPGEGVLELLRRRGVVRLDRVVLSHPHPDHYGGLLPVVRELPVGELWASRRPHTDESAFLELVGDRPLRLPDPLAPDLAVLHPLRGWTSPASDPTNDESLTVKFGLGSVRFLLPGDVERAGEARLLEEPARLGATVLKAPHHGSATSSSPAFVSAVDPALVVIPCGWENRFGHPRPTALASYRGRRVLRTDLDGTVVVKTDGEAYTVSRVAAPDPRWRYE